MMRQLLIGLAVLMAGLAFVPSATASCQGKWINLADHVAVDNCGGHFVLHLYDCPDAYCGSDGYFGHYGQMCDSNGCVYGHYGAVAVGLRVNGLQTCVQVNSACYG